METAVGILVLVVVGGAIWWGVRARKRYHDEHDRPQTGSGGGNGPPKRTDKV